MYGVLSSSFHITIHYNVSLMLLSFTVT